MLNKIFYVIIYHGDGMKKDIENKVDNEFADINKDNAIKSYIIVGILYILVLILTIFLILGIQNQKEVIDNNYNNNIEENIQNKVENEIDNDIQVENNAVENEVNDELNILDQLR